MTPPTGATSSDAGGRGQLAVGDSVEANYFDEGTYYRGQVTAVYPGGSCDILYEDGDDEQQVPPGRIRSLPEPAQGKLSPMKLIKGHSPMKLMGKGIKSIGGLSSVVGGTLGGTMGGMRHLFRKQHAQQHARQPQQQPPQQVPPPQQPPPVPPRPPLAGASSQPYDATVITGSDGGTANHPFGKRTRGGTAALAVVSAAGELRAGKGLVGGFSRRLRDDPMSQGTW